MSGRKSVRDKRRAESVSDSKTQSKVSSKSRNASTSDTTIMLQETTTKLRTLSTNSSGGVSRQNSKKKGSGARSRLSSNEDPIPDLFESSYGEESKKIVVLSERRQIRNEITSNVKAKEAERAERAELQAMKEKANKIEANERFYFFIKSSVVF